MGDNMSKEKKEEVKKPDCFKKYPWSKPTAECRKCNFHVACKKGTKK